MNENRNKQRQQRRLPKIPIKRNGKMENIMSYSESETWLQKHQGVLNKSISILEMHPKLIQHSSCDRLWEFISKLSIINYDENKARLNSLSNNTTKNDTKSGVLHLPQISISDSSDVKGTELVKKVFVCGKREDPRWYPIIGDVSEKYFVKYLGVDTTDKDMYLNDEHHPSEDTVMLFTMDEHSIYDPNSLKLLKAAKGRGCRVLTVRHKGFLLPAIHTPAEDTESHININNNTVYMSKSLVSATRYNDETRPSSKISVTNPNNLKMMRPDSGISLLSGRSSSCSGGIRLTPNTKHNVEYDLSSVIGPIERDQLYSGVSMMDKLSELLRGEFEQALIYNEEERADSMANILAGIEGLPLGGKGNTVTADKHEIPDTDNRMESTTLHYKNDTLKSANHTASAAAGQYTNRTSRRESIDTFFLVFPLHVTGGGEPTVVHYPDDTNLYVPPSPSIESFGFQDIDLSKAINDLDLFSSEDDDELT